MLYHMELLSLPDILVIHRNSFQVFLQCIKTMGILPNVIAPPRFLDLEEINICLVYFKSKVCMDIKYMYYIPSTSFLKSDTK